MLPYFQIYFKFIYHRLDLERPDEPYAHFSRYAAKGKLSEIMNKKKNLIADKLVRSLKFLKNIFLRNLDL